MLFYSVSDFFHSHNILALNWRFVNEKHKFCDEMMKNQPSSSVMTFFFHFSFAIFIAWKSIEET